MSKKLRGYAWILSLKKRINGRYSINKGNTLKEKLKESTDKEDDSEYDTVDLTHH